MVVGQSNSRHSLQQGGSPLASTTSTMTLGQTLRSQPLLVVKVGTSSLMMSDSSSGFRVNLANLARLVDVIGELKRGGNQVVLVSSGAVGMGCIKLALDQKPTNMGVKQAVAAAGQSHLVRLYEDMFGALNLQVAQLLINQSDFLDQEHWRSVKATIRECLDLGVVPIINENDSTNTAEMRFGDNDNLASLTAVQLEADALFLCTDVDYLYTANPRSDPDAKALRVVDEPWALQVDTSAEGSGLGTGGMATKILAARTASTAGIPCGLINGEHPERIWTFLKYGLKPGELAEEQEEQAEAKEEAKDRLPEGTLFMPMQSEHQVCDTRRWILSLPATAEVSVDDSCARALAGQKCLDPQGISQVKGSFEKNDAVRLLHRGKEIGRGLFNVSSQELDQLRRQEGIVSGDSDDSLERTGTGSSGAQISSSAPEAGALQPDNVVLTVAGKALNPANSRTHGSTAVGSGTAGGA